jgi:predicted GNAT family acetyltransferase
MSMVLDELVRKTEQSIVDVEDRIEVRRAIVAKMESAGSEMRVARELLRALQRSHLTLVMHRKQLRDILPLSARGTRSDFQRLAAKLVDKSEWPIDDETENRVRVARH